MNNRESDIPREYRGYEESRSPRVIVDKTNTIASIFKFLGWATIILGIIMGFVTGNIYTQFFSWSLALYTWIGSFISGMFFLGFSEIVQCLHELRLKI